MKHTTVGCITGGVSFLILAVSLLAAPPGNGYHLLKKVLLGAAPGGGEHFDYITFAPAPAPAAK